MNSTIVTGDARALPFPDGVAQTCVTSPPYFGLRDYGVDGQIGLEQTPDEYVAQIVAVMHEVWRVLRDDGTLWLNLGDSYGTGTTAMRVRGSRGIGANTQAAQDAVGRVGGAAKQLLGIPWRVAFALQADGWYLRSDIVWAKPNPMPESVTDRPTKAHEYVFLLAKSERYYYDADAIAEKAEQPNGIARNTGQKKAVILGQSSGTLGTNYGASTRNARSVWQITPTPYSGAHFATMPPELARRCILAGSRPCDLVLDPFTGSGTTAKVALELGRSFIGTELSEQYVKDHAHERTSVTLGMGI